MEPSTTVVGAGIAGLSAALLLAQKGRRVNLFESSRVPGGLLSPIVHEGIPCDCGSHRVHPDAHPLLLQLTREAKWQTRPRAGKLILNGRQLPYPLDPLRFLGGLGFKTAMNMGLGWLQRPNALKRMVNWESDRRHVQKDQGFESFVTQRVGNAAYAQFYEPYARKVWGIDPNELSQTVAKQRVSTSNPAAGILRRGEQQFLYPRGGMAELIQTLREKACAVGVKFSFGQRFDLSHSPETPVFYTGHLSDLVTDAKLTHRGLYLLHITLPNGAVDSTDTWYAPEARYWFGRVSQPAQFSESLTHPQHQILCVEIPEGQWGSNQNFVENIDTLITQLYDAGILRRVLAPLHVQQTFVPRVYPMYTRGWVGEQRRVLTELASRGPIFPCGRQGLFLHCNMDHAVATAAAAVTHWENGGDSLRWVEKSRRFANFRVRD